MPRAFESWSLVSLSLLFALSGCNDGEPSDDEVIADASESVEGSNGESVDTSESVGSSESVDTTESTESTDTTESTESTDTSIECSYPEGAVEPMALDEVLWAYSWPTAIHADGTTTTLDLLHVPCDTDEVIDWSIHELLVFISLPAW
jgi:hypothetical protein